MLVSGSAWPCVQRGKGKATFYSVVQLIQRLQKLRSPSASWYLFLRIRRQTPQPYSLDGLCCQICTLVWILVVPYSSCIRSSGFMEMSNLFDWGLYVTMLANSVPVLTGSVHEGYRHLNVCGGACSCQVLDVRSLSQELRVYRGDWGLAYPDRGRELATLAEWVVEVEVAAAVDAALLVKEVLAHWKDQLFERLS